MRFEILVGMLSAYCLSTVMSRAPRFIPKLICKSGIVGLPCSKLSCQEPCKKGYSCKEGYCCRDPVCPKGWIGEESCNLTPGEQRCPDHYQCIDNFCCKEETVIPQKRKCPKGTTQVSGKCRRHPFPYRSFRFVRRCPYGSHCYSGTCCRTLTNADLCPKEKPPEVCPEFVRDPDECKTNADCSKGSICCKDPCDVKFCYKK